MNLKIKNVSLTIEGKSIIRNISITVNPGEVVDFLTVFTGKTSRS